MSRDENANFLGHRYPEDHRTTGERAWSFRCHEWCYPETPCAVCEVEMAAEDPCPCCNGTGRRTGGQT